MSVASVPQGETVAIFPLNTTGDERPLFTWQTMTARRRKGERDDDPHVMDIGKLFGKKPAWACMRAGPIADVDGTTLGVMLLAFAWLSVLAR